MPNSSKIPPKKQYRTLLAVALGGILIGAGLHYALSASHKQENCVSDLKRIKSNLDCEVSDKKAQQLSRLQERLEIAVPVYIKSGKANKIGVFARDMKTSRFAGVNDNDNFIMASLLKVPLLIAGYKLAEVEPKVLEQTIRYTGTPDLYAEQAFEIDDRLAVNSTYAVKELMRRSVTFSDNTAATLLSMALPAGYFDRILSALGLQIRSDDGNDENFTTPRSYANMFRLLYNASYLTKEYSNEALETLTQTTYRGGAIAKLPPSMDIAHKFAERTVTDDKTGETLFRQLHECGLAYADQGNNPYTFCIMTEGKDFDELEKIQQEISLLIYQAMTDGMQ